MEQPDMRFARSTQGFAGMRDHTDTTWSEHGMSNCDDSIDDGLEADLRAGMWAIHSAWHFNGQVRYDAEAEVFKEDVWRYHVLAAERSAVTLDDLRRTVNDEFGWD